MDIVPAIFKMILEYLYMVNISEDVPPLPEVVNAKKDIFDTYVDFFKLRSEAGPETLGTRDNILVYHGREGDDGQIDARARYHRGKALERGGFCCILHESEGYWKPVD